MLGLPRSIQSQWEDLRQQWQERPVLRLALWAACALVSVHLVLLAQDWRDARAEEYRRLATDWLKLQEISRQTAWPERALQAESVLNRMREGLWQAPNASQARADVQAWLSEQVRKTGLRDAKVSVLAPQGFDEQGVVARIEAQVQGQLEPGSFSELLHALESEPRRVSVEFLELNNTLSPTLNLQLSFLFLPSPASAGP
ncbi:hypothetical protein D9M68_141890 [compost metagenome]